MRRLTDARAGADEREPPPLSGAVFGERAHQCVEVTGRADGVAARDGGRAVQLVRDKAVDARGLEVAPAVVERKQREAVVAMRLHKAQAALGTRFGAGPVHHASIVGAEYEARVRMARR